MTYEASNIDEYIDQLPEDRKKPFSRLRSVILENLPEGYQECISYKMPSFAVPHSVYPAGYHCKPEEPLPFLSIGSQKNFIGYYHMGIYSIPELLDWFQTEWADRNLGKLDMGKSCIRLNKMDQIPYDLLGELASKVSVEEWIAIYEKMIKH